jgi:hypothetical protein
MFSLMKLQVPSDEFTLYVYRGLEEDWAEPESLP